ncbi:HNH endonuclease signature motif containing protein [Corynebacterium pyruviciproducens]|uniref:HNH endonuclease signature motif containing protein n=1 Tax=Corynebacterium pyruviciproducens TaxID=598660 RepID=UPI001FDFBB82|nr:HNH endonuclease signature motif containing protein [Corynebacterium pyruviciproducens]
MVNLTATAEELASQCATTAKALAGKLCAYATLNHLPELKAWIEEKNLLDARRLQVIADTLCEVRLQLSDDLSAFDHGVVQVLQPTRKDQYIPTPGEIRKKVRKLLTKLYGVKFKKWERTHKDTLNFWHSCDIDESIMVASFNEAVGAEVEARILEVARQWKVSPIEALQRIILTNVKMKITLNTYGADGKVEYADHLGDLTPELSDYFTERVSRVRDMNEAAKKVSSCYKPSKLIRDFVKGRDGTCRFPGCDVPADRCELDHVQDYLGGGPTSPDDLHLLCHRHHALKTMGIVQVIMDGLGIDTWFFASGKKTTTLPRGPLAGLAAKMGLRNSFTRRREWLFKPAS